MPAPTEPVSGIRSLIKIDNTLVGMQTDATLNLPTENVEIVTKNNFGWSETLPGVTDWSLDLSNLAVDTAGNAFISNDTENRCQLEIDIAGTPTIVPKLESLEFTLSQATEKRSTLDSGLVQGIFLGERSMSLSASAQYIDPEAADGAALAEILRARDAAERVGFTLTVDQYELSGTISIGDLSFSSGAEAAPMMVDISANSTGEVTTGGTDLHTSVSMLLAAFFSQTAVTAGMELDDGAGSTITGSTKYEGSGYATEISFSASAEDAASMDTTIEGDGALSQVVVA